MKKYYFTVGPSQLYPTVPKHIRNALAQHIPSISHRSQTFKTIYQEAVDNLRTLLDIPKTHHIFFTTSALEGMERTIQNTVKKHSFHFVNGSFSREFYQIASDLKKDAVRYDAQNGEGFDLGHVTIPAETELITFIQNETSTGVQTPLEDIYAIAKRYPKKLIAIDVVSSIPYPNIDYTKIDVTLFSVQKGFGLPAGLGVLIVGPRAMQKAHELNDSGENVGSYHNFIKLEEFGTKSQTRETPNVLNIYLLAKVTEDMLRVGMTKMRKQTEKKAKLLYDFFDHHPTYKPYAKNPFRSLTTIVIDVQGKSKAIVENAAKHGFIIAQGYGKRKDDHIRIANFPTHTLQQTKKLLTIIKR